MPEPEKVSAPIPHVVADALIAFFNEQALQVHNASDASELRMAAIVVKTAKRTSARTFISF